MPPPPPPPKESPFPGFLAWFASRGTTLHPAVVLERPAHSLFYRISLESTGGGVWTLSEVSFFNNGVRAEVAGPKHITSAWMPAGKGSEWVYVDLGARCTIDRIALYWIRRATGGTIQVSDGAEKWTDVMPLSARTEPVDDLALGKPIQCKYVRVLLNQAGAPGNCILSELEVYGRGGSRVMAKSMPAARENGMQYLSGGGWRLQRASLVNAGGESLSRAGFHDTDWIVATVPATVLASYHNIGALPDPNFGSNQLMISDSFFCADFWYRTEFMAPPGPLSCGKPMITTSSRPRDTSGAKRDPNRFTFSGTPRPTTLRS